MRGTGAIAGVSSCSLTGEQFLCGGSYARLVDVPLLGLFVNARDSREFCPDTEQSASMVTIGGERLLDLTALRSLVKIVNIMQSLVTHAG